VRLDNLTAPPASLLLREADYEAIANDLPRGEVLLVLPRTGAPERTAIQGVAQLFRAKSRHGTVLTENRLEPIGRR